MTKCLVASCLLGAAWLAGCSAAREDPAKAGLPGGGGPQGSITPEQSSPPLAQCEPPPEGSPTPGGRDDMDVIGDDDVAPAPPSIGADIPLTYFGPPPSSVQPELVGPVQLLKAGQLDTAAGTITLPLYRGQVGAQPVWFVLTDTTDLGNAQALGLNHSAKLHYANNGGNSVRIGRFEMDASVTFDRGLVDFSPERRVVPGAPPDFFPPSVAQPGAVGDAGYSPLVLIENAGFHVYNAPIVAGNVTADELNAWCTGSPDYARVHDKVVRICPQEGTVTLSLTPGFSFAKPVLYLSMDANTELAAAMEGVTLAPGLGDVPVGRDDSAFSAVERIFAFVNGPSGRGNPQRQGFNSALAGEGGPLNVLGGIPTVATDYSPLWDLNLGEWTQDAISKGYRSRLTEEFAILGFAQRGFVTGPGGMPYGSTGIIINCPIVHRFL
ncbi:MAG: hypothetical protein L0Y66_00900 [Myxococcaceae bacterium]|nr:hypothetical protein [Myxococcaceae bacterium]MCI0669704.1 hypothetical protein [Myxococcaceae bacterium]